MQGHASTLSQHTHQRKLEHRAVFIVESDRATTSRQVFTFVLGTTNEPLRLRILRTPNDGQ